MIEQMTILPEIRNLIQAQQYDNAWYFSAGAILDVYPTKLLKTGWVNDHWKSEWGQINIETVNDENILIWNRPDGGPLLGTAYTDDDYNICCIKFALNGALIKALQSVGQLSYARVGFPESWANCVVTVNSKEINGVYEADVIQGYCLVPKRDSKGSLVAVDGEIQQERVIGSVEIIVKKERQAFF